VSPTDRTLYNRAVRGAHAPPVPPSMSIFRLLQTCLALALLAALPVTAAPPALLAPTSDGATLELPALDPTVPSPAAFLGRPIGAEFTHHDRILAYLGALAAASDRVRLVDYGTTYEGRPLRLAFISSPRNLQHLEEIRAAHLRLADPARLGDGERERLLQTTPPIVWLAYGVHGNETSSPEAAMIVAYALAASTGPAAAALDDLVVVIDPLVNPDGHERYTSFFESRVGRDPDADPQSAEHLEPWPGGRENHYLIDLNRDWAWATQRETRARLAVLRAWEPQVYVDFHEMGHRPPTYFFPPPSEPVLPRLDHRQLAWIQAFGRANAAALDRHGWMYFTRETYDLFYPGYGDTYPGLRGIVGMTYEVSGGGSAGLAVRTAAGIFRLADRVARHVTTSLATVATADANRRALLADGVATEEAAQSAPPRSYLWSAGQQEARSLADLLLRHGVRVERLARPAEIKLRPLAGGDETKRELPAGTYAVSTAQPLGNLVRALLDQDPAMPDAYLREQRQRVEDNRNAQFYDITAWSLPLAYNLEVSTADETLSDLLPATDVPGTVSGSGEAGFLVAPQGLASYRLAAQLLRRGGALRIATQPVRAGGRDYPAGTLFLPRVGNAGDLPAWIAEVAAQDGLAVDRLAALYAERGVLLGSRSVLVVKPPRVALVRGEGVDPTSFGSLWHLLDREVELPHTVLELGELGRARLDRYDALVLPSGSYDERIGEKTVAAIDQWVKAGGVLVVVGDAAAWAIKRGFTALHAWEPPKHEEEAAAEETAGRAPPTGNVADRTLEVPGAILSTEMRRHVLLTAGVSTPPPVLFTGSLILMPTGDPQIDLLTAAQRSPVQAGFVWPEAKSRLEGALLLARQERGAGAVVTFAQDPAFRDFWRGTMPLFLNAVMYEPSLHGDGD